MNRRWLALIKGRELTCHICGLFIISHLDLSRDHYPIPKSKGGCERRPAHYWCDQAHGNHLDAHNPRYLERLIVTWNNNGVPFPARAYQSVYKLQRDLIAQRGPNDVELKRSVDFLFNVPHERRNNKWERQLKLYFDLMQGDLMEFRRRLITDMIVNDH